MNLCFYNLRKSGLTSDFFAVGVLTLRISIGYNGCHIPVINISTDESKLKTSHKIQAHARCMSIKSKTVVITGYNITKNNFKLGPLLAAGVS